LSTGKKTPKIVPSIWDCATPPEEDRATAVGDMHKTFSKDRECVSRDMLAYRQTNTHRQTYRRAHYNNWPPTAHAGEVTNSINAEQDMTVAVL